MLARPMPVEAVQVVGGRPEVNPERGQLQYWAQGTEKLSVVPIAAGGSADDSFVIKPEKNGCGDFNLAFFSSRHLGAYRVQLQALGGIDKRLTNGFVHIDFIAAAAGAFPLYVPTPLWLEAKTGLRVQYQNVSSDVANSAELVMHGRRLIDVTPEQRAAVLEKAYNRSEWPIWLGLDDVIVSLTASQANVPARITVPADGDVEVEYLLVKSRGPVRVQIANENGTPLLYGGGPAAVGGATPVGVRGVQVSGVAMFPYRMPMGGWLNRQEFVNVTLEDLSGATNTVELCLVGRCLSYPEGRGRGGYTESPGESVKALAASAANPMPQRPWQPPRQAPPAGNALRSPGWMPTWLR